VGLVAGVSLLTGNVEKNDRTENVFEVSIGFENYFRKIMNRFAGRMHLSCSSCCINKNISINVPEYVAYNDTQKV
jgi:hypothetical protein